MFQSSLRFTMVAAGGALALGCAGSVQPAKPVSASPRPPIAAAPAPKSAKERLLTALRAIERPAPVLDLLPEAARDALQTRLKGLSPEQREHVLRGELASAVPLLHLQAGGSSASALYTLCSSPAAEQELPQAFQAEAARDDEKRRSVRLVHDLAQRAAQHFLRDRVLDVANAPEADVVPLFSAIERVAITAERPDIARLALETWAAAKGGADVHERLAAACAFAEDEACFQQAAKSLPESSSERARLGRLEQALRARASGEPLVKAWALLTLGRYADARVALAPVEAKAKTDLRVAAALAVVASDGTACPGLQPLVGSPRLCADAVTVRPGLSSALADMQAAWVSGGGRDAASAEAYVGLAHVVPWVTSLALATDPATLERDFSERYQALSRVVSALPEQKPFAVFAAAFEAGVTAGLRSHGERPQVDSSRKQELWFAALGTDAPAARLAVGSVLAADQTVLQLLPAAVPVNLVSARAGLLAWEAAGGTDAAAVEAAKGALTEVLGVSPRGGTQSASAVLLLAELDAVTAPSERTHRALAQISSQLIGEALEPDLALRAVLDAAGALERLGRSADALGVLTKAAEIQSLPGPAAELLALIRAEKLVLEWDAKKDPQRLALAKALAGLQLSGGPPTLAFAVGAWSSPKVLKQGKLAPKAALEQRIGARAAELMAKGALRGTRVSLRVSYAFQTGLLPEVAFDPMFVPLVRPDLIQKTF